MHVCIVHSCFILHFKLIFPLPQVAAEHGFRDVLLEQLVRLLAPQQGRGATQQQLLQAGPGDNLCNPAGRRSLPRNALPDTAVSSSSSISSDVWTQHSICAMSKMSNDRGPSESAEGDAAAAASALLAGSPQAARRQSLAARPTAAGAAALNGVSSSPQQLSGVPKLTLPPGATAMPVGGLTRSSRRAGSNWNSPAPSPLPSPAPFFPGQNRCSAASLLWLGARLLVLRGDCCSRLQMQMEKLHTTHSPQILRCRPHQSTAKAELAALGQAIGEALVISDMTAVVGHHRRSQLAAELPIGTARSACAAS